MLITNLWWIFDFCHPLRGKFGKPCSRLPLFTLESGFFEFAAQWVAEIEDPRQIRYQH